MDLGHNILRLRERKKMTQQALERAARVPQSSISRIEKGTLGNPGIETVKRIATALEVTVNDLLEDSSSGGPSPAT
ncbi:helix-turn-helix transcriptional regulator|uniref:Helix-turn-helix n=1 Tax=Dendrosporobacter quercicolus TaxID=146817 RepID=A0A1G9TWQ3_9FIRM|nr:helix-turn-helix transcriptional regulator [Dendrosporobacter quercicolus]NSL48826.1 helix-turn-helix transcriptional regulator [Dendrosporobacter quercicolus DSM 1736]SDM52083.1 Helix-turn-helix [Dendrosporobacter quercicolus]